MAPKSVCANIPLLCWFYLALLAIACQPSVTGIETGGETHFLKTCSPTNDVCGAELDCVCGVCTATCDDPSACAALPGAVCMEAASEEACGEVTAGPHCDLPCEEDTDCQAISQFHVCDRGVCRTQGPEPLTTVEPSTSEPNTAKLDSGTPDAGALCEATGLTANELLIIGDSFFANTHQVTAYLETLARYAGALGEGERYRDESRVVGNTLAAAGNGIEQQYAAALEDAPVKVVIMNGGGADALLATCESPDETCEALQDAAGAAATLLDTMATNGVEDVVYVYYPDSPDTVLQPKLDALRPLIQNACQRAPLNCHWLDLRSLFADHTATYLAMDGALPTAAGSKATAEGIWDVMTANCIAQ